MNQGNKTTIIISAAPNTFANTKIFLIADLFILPT